MYSGQDLLGEMYHNMELAEQGIKELAKHGTAKANAEAEYEIALAKKMLEKKSEGIPATILKEICKGEREVALLKVRWHCEEALWDACKESIFLAKKRVDAYREQIAREWSGAKYE